MNNMNQYELIYIYRTHELISVDMIPDMNSYWFIEVKQKTLDLVFWPNYGGALIDWAVKMEGQTCTP